MIASPTIELAMSAQQRPATTADGAIGTRDNVVGTMLHGVLEHEGLRSALLQTLWERRGVARPARAPVASAAQEYDRLEATVRAHLDLDLLRRLARVG